MADNHNPDDVTIKITPNDCGNPPGKLADVEIHFVGDSLFSRLKSIGFSVWERRRRQWSEGHVPGAVVLPQRRASELRALHPIFDTSAQNRLRERILEAFAEYEETVAANV